MTTVICEGYQDRDFLKGALFHLGCTDDSKVVSGAGRYGFRSASGAALAVVPAKAQRGVDLARLVCLQFENLQDGLQNLAHLVVCLDDDGLDPGACQSTQLPCGLGPLVAAWTRSDHTWHGPAGQRLSVVWWHHLAPPRPGVPAKQTLERVLCSALAAVAPDCADAVEAWLASRPDGLPIPVSAAAQAKAPALSYLAGWFADGGSEGFAQRLWAHHAVRAELVASLTATGVWPILQQVAA